MRRCWQWLMIALGVDTRHVTVTETDDGLSVIDAGGLSSEQAADALYNEFRPIRVRPIRSAHRVEFKPCNNRL